MTADETGIVKPTSAYHQYAKMVTTAVRNELLKEGKDVGVGNVMGTVSQRWKELSDEDRKPYEDLAEEDRQRYLKECAERDAEMLQRQEERRNQNKVGDVMESRGRSSTTIKTAAANANFDQGRKPRRLTEEKRIEREEREASRKEEEMIIKAQKAELNKAKAEQAQHHS